MRKFFVFTDLLCRWLSSVRSTARKQSEPRCATVFVRSLATKQYLEEKEAELYKPHRPSWKISYDQTNTPGSEEATEIECYATCPLRGWISTLKPFPLSTFGETILMQWRGVMCSSILSRASNVKSSDKEPVEEGRQQEGDVEQQGGGDSSQGRRL